MNLFYMILSGGRAHMAVYMTPPLVMPSSSEGYLIMVLYSKA